MAEALRVRREMRKTKGNEEHVGGSVRKAPDP